MTNDPSSQPGESSDDFCGMLVVARLVELNASDPERRKHFEGFSAFLFSNMVAAAKAEGKTDEEIESLTEGVMREVNMIRLNARSTN